MEVALYTHPAMLDHRPPTATPSGPARLTRGAGRACDDSGLDLDRREAPLVGRDDLRRVHPRALPRRRSTPRRAERGSAACSSTPDTGLSPGSREAALRAAGAVSGRGAGGGGRRGPAGLLRRAPARPSRGADARHGLLHLLQRRHRRAGGPGRGARPGRRRRLRRPPRQRHPGGGRERRQPLLRLGAPEPALSRHRLARPRPASATWSTPPCRRAPPRERWRAAFEGLVERDRRLRPRPDPDLRRLRRPRPRPARRADRWRPRTTPGRRGPWSAPPTAAAAAGSSPRSRAATTFRG